jgi:hypothetical protein
MTDNLNDLTRAAKIKLDTQKRQAEETGIDIYADIRNESETEEYGTYPKLTPTPENLMGPTEGMQFQDNTDYNVDNPINEEDYQVYENGPFYSQVELWKKQYGEGRVLHTQIIDRHFVFRTINRFEYKQLVAMENVDALVREEIICATCVLHPRNFNFKIMANDEAVYPGTLAQIIMESSGFTKEYGIEVL